MKIGVSSYSFSALYKNGRFTLFDAIEYTRKTGFDAIEFTDLAPPEGKNVQDFAKEVAAACSAAGLLIASYTIGADEVSINALARVMPYAFHVHAKDFLWKSGAEPKPDGSWFSTRGGNHLRGTIVGHGVVSVAQCLAYIKSTGYDNTVSLEFEGLEEPLEAIRLGYEFLKAQV